MANLANLGGGEVGRGEKHALLRRGGAFGNARRHYEFEFARDPRQGGRLQKTRVERATPARPTNFSRCYYRSVGCLLS